MLVRVRERREKEEREGVEVWGITWLSGLDVTQAPHLEGFDFSFAAIISNSLSCNRYGKTQKVYITQNEHRNHCGHQLSRSGHLNTLVWL